MGPHPGDQGLPHRGYGGLSGRQAGRVRRAVSLRRPGTGVHSLRQGPDAHHPALRQAGQADRGGVPRDRDHRCRGRT